MKTIALAGNPNVGKSTLFNTLTGMKQHTGNWPGKTVEIARGYLYTKENTYYMVDIPGTYSLNPRSREEEVARDLLIEEELDAVIVLCDAVCLERTLGLALQIMEIRKEVIVCVNLLDEAKKKGIFIDLDKLSELLGVPVIGTSARNKKSKEIVSKILDKRVFRKEKGKIFEQQTEIIKRAEKIVKEVVSVKNENYQVRDRKWDEILTSRKYGYPMMMILLMSVLWLTIAGANVPSSWLARGLFWVQDYLLEFFMWIEAPVWMGEMIVLGSYRVLAWVVSVMLPPMAIFFPLFTLLEDVGYLPRVAYNMDYGLKKCTACGKQALTMCMGLGCNATGVIGCRIIDSKRERFLAILTNSFIPCNGRFPTLIALITMFFVENSFFSAVILSFMICLSIFMTFIVSKVLSSTLLKGEGSSFVMEMPPFRKPQIGKVLVRSIFDRTLTVLARAVIVAIPAGFLIWIMANIQMGNDTILNVFVDCLEPIGKFMGLDGAILVAFLLGMPANEIVIPVLLMIYLQETSILEMEDLKQMKALFLNHGWTMLTSVNMAIFSLFHWPCSTTIWTIKKETKSIGFTILAVLLPTVIGMVLCSFTTLILG